jgi:hypothetical protein
MKIKGKKGKKRRKLGKFQLHAKKRLRAYLWPALPSSYRAARKTGKENKVGNGHPSYLRQVTIVTIWARAGALCWSSPVPWRRRLFVPRTVAPSAKGQSFINYRTLTNMDQITIKTPNPKCRLYRYLFNRVYRLEIVSHVGIFDPSCELAPF